MTVSIYTVLLGIPTGRDPADKGCLIAGNLFRCRGKHRKLFADCGIISNPTSEPCNLMQKLAGSRSHPAWCTYLRQDTDGLTVLLRSDFDLLLHHVCNRMSFQSLYYLLIMYFLSIIHWDTSSIVLYRSCYLFLFRSQVITFINYNILYCCMDFSKDSGLATFPSGPFPYLYNFLPLILPPEKWEEYLPVYSMLDELYK